MRRGLAPTQCLVLVYCLGCFPMLSYAQAQPAQPHGGALELAINRLSTVGSVLYVAAHPDDENTRLLAYLVGHLKLRAGYLSMTRGDGGQNLLGSERGDRFGVIRTQELVAARRLDGAEQFFTRAKDFGYSKSAKETLRIWGEQEILADVVWVIRKFRPDVIITRFPATGGRGHGHHTASAVLAENAFRLAADAEAFPEQLEHVQPWQADRLLWNKFSWRQAEAQDLEGLPKIDVGGYNPLLGKSYGEIAGESRSMHRSQGFGAARQRGQALEHFVPVLGTKPDGDPLAGLDFTWRRIKKTGNLRATLARASQSFSADAPDRVIPALLQARAALQELPAGHWREYKLAELDRAVLACAGFYAELVAKVYFGVPGGKTDLVASVINRSAVEAEVRAIRWPDGRKTGPLELRENVVATAERTITIPENTPYTHPYWLTKPSSAGRYAAPPWEVYGLPTASPPLMAFIELSILGKPFTVRRAVTYKWVDPVGGEKVRPFEVVPPITATPGHPVVLFPDAKPRTIRIRLNGFQNDARATVRLKAPRGYTVTPAINRITMNKGDEHTLLVSIKPPKKLTTDPVDLMVEVEVSGERFDRALHRIEYDHIPIQSLLPRAVVRLVPVALVRRHTRVGYVQGAGDDVAESLRQVGYDVETLTDERLEQGDFTGLDAIVIGIRAYNTNPRMRFHTERLLDWVKKGGTMIAQYSTSTRRRKLDYAIGPYPLEIARGRVTDETAALTAIRPDHPVLTSPNRLGPADFDGWVQERGLYFAEAWDERYQPVFETHDPGEEEQKGSLLVAKYGKGTFIYTGLSFFRQLPAGVPGAYRLFANLLAQ